MKSISLRGAGAALVALFGLLGAGALAAQPAADQPVGGAPSNPALATYTNTAYSFSLRFPKGLVVAPGSGPWSTVARLGGGPRTGKALLRITVFRVDHRDATGPYPYPRFYDSSVTVGVSTDIAACYGSASASGGPVAAPVVSLGGHLFHKLNVMDVGGSQYTLATSYRIIHDNRCFAIDQIERDSDYRDRYTRPGLSDADLIGYYDEAGVIARTFRFTDATTQAGSASQILPPDLLALEAPPTAPAERAIRPPRG